MAGFLLIGSGFSDLRQWKRASSPKNVGRAGVESTTSHDFDQLLLL